MSALYNAKTTPPDLCGKPHHLTGMAAAATAKKHNGCMYAQQHLSQSAVSSSHWVSILALNSTPPSRSGVGVAHPACTIMQLPCLSVSLSIQQSRPHSPVPVLHQTCSRNIHSNVLLRGNQPPVHAGRCTSMQQPQSSHDSSMLRHLLQVNCQVLVSSTPWRCWPARGGLWSDPGPTQCAQRQVLLMRCSTAQAPGAPCCQAGVTRVTPVSACQQSTVTNQPAYMIHLLYTPHHNTKAV